MLEFIEWCRLNLHPIVIAIGAGALYCAPLFFMLKMLCEIDKATRIPEDS